jgi:hypothetical protein
MRLAATALLSLTLVLATPLATPNSAEGSPLAPLNTGGEHIEDAYIVVLKKDVNPAQVALHMAGLDKWHGADVSSQAVSVVLSPSPPYQSTDHYYLGISGVWPPGTCRVLASPHILPTLTFPCRYPQRRHDDVVAQL